jgi:NAD(P)-dependent dehydrogenase (short-subunit alcohol dehydrogenase family)
MASVIVFGPTGNIGSVTARTAAEHGAKVALAMRDTNKAIPGLSKEKEQSGSFTRVQADLLKPETVAEAVKTSGAKRAFVYLAHAAPDHMKSALEAMKGAGVEFVVFLSSFTVHRDKPLRDIPPSDIIDYVHGQVEASLDDVFGPQHYVALRPGSFATNLLRDKKGIVAGEAPLFRGQFKQDWITAVDMGEVSGRILVDGPKNGQDKVFSTGYNPYVKHALSCLT